MAKHNHKIVSPPQLAERLLALAVNKQDRPTLLGDLHEEFDERRRKSQTQARSWYWRQVLLSAPPLLRQRVQQNAAFGVAAILTVTLLSFAFISLWDIYVARKCAQFLAQRIAEPPLLIIRMIYFLIMLGGVVAAGSLIARSLFFEENSFGKNAATRLLPTALLLVGAAAITWISAGGNYPASYLMLRLGLAIPALVLGARLATRHLQHKSL